MDIKLSKQDVEWLQEYYPELRYEEIHNIIKGDLFFTREHEERIISDNYNIEISLVTKQGSFFPVVKEVDGKIFDLSKKLNCKPIDLHINEPDDSLCLVIDKREGEYFKNGFNIREFIKVLLEPFLYRTSHIDKYDKAPKNWEEYAHGNLGYLELYAEGGISINELEDKIGNTRLIEFMNMKGGNLCPCDSKSKSKLRDCHKLIYKAAHKLKEEF